MFYLILLAVPLLAVVYLATLPDVSALKKKNPKRSSFMKYRQAARNPAIQQIRIYQEWVPLSRVSPYLIKAVIIAEDDKFWSHEGFDYEAIQAAIEKDLKSKKYKRGGSTITQQLARNLYLSPEKSLFRKLREAVITWKLERTLSKRRILELYLNVVEWGDGLYGVEAASQFYFGKSSFDVTAIEASRLVSVLPNPRKYRPDGNQKYVLNRSNMIYQVMVERGLVVPEFEEMTREGTLPAVSSDPLSPAIPPEVSPPPAGPAPILPSTAVPD